MPETDPVAARLGSLAVPDTVKADVWDAFQHAATADEFATTVQRFAIPDAVKADLWDLKQAAATAAPVFAGTNEKNAAGEALVRDVDFTERTGFDVGARMIPGFGSVLAQATDRPGDWLYDAAKSWVAAGPHAVVEGVRDLLRGNYAKAAHGVGMGSAITAAPFYAPALLEAAVAAPGATATSVAASTAAGAVAAPVAKEAALGVGLSEDQAQVAEDAAMLAGGWAGSKVTPASIKAAATSPVVRTGLRTVGAALDNPAVGIVAPRLRYTGELATNTAAALDAAAGRRVAAAAAARVPPPVPAPAAPTATPAPAGTVASSGAAPARVQTVPQQAPPAPPVVPMASPAAASGPRAAVVPATEATPWTPSTAAPAAVARRWGPTEAIEALQAAAARAGYPISGDELKYYRPSVMAVGAEAGPAVAAAQVERLQAQAAIDAAAREAPATVSVAAPPPAPVVPAEPAPAAAAPVAVTPLPDPPVAPVSVVRPPSRPVAPAPAPVASAPVVAAPTTTAPASVMSGAQAEGLIWQAAERAHLERVKLTDARAAADLVQQGVEPDAALAEVLSSGTITAPRPPPGAAPAPPPMSGAKAEGLVWQAANRLDPERPLKIRVVEAAGKLVQQGQTPEAALAEALAADAAGVATDPAAALAARLGTPTLTEAERAIDARWRRGELKTPSAPTAARMQAEADARIAAEKAAAQTAAAAPPPAPKRATRRAPKVTAPAAATAAPRETEAYRGYLIRRNPVSNEMWVEKDGFRIGGAASAEDAKRTIEMLTAA